MHRILLPAAKKKNMKTADRNPFSSLWKVRACVTELIFMEINIARQLFLNKFYTEYHENPTGFSVADVTLLTDWQTCYLTLNLVTWKIWWAPNNASKWQTGFNTLAPELFFLILAHSVYKMWIIQEPNKLALWNKLHFEEKKTESIEHV